MILALALDDAVEVVGPENALAVADLAGAFGRSETVPHARALPPRNLEHVAHLGLVGDHAVQGVFARSGVLGQRAGGREADQRDYEGGAVGGDERALAKRGSCLRHLVQLTRERVEVGQGF